MSQNTENKKRTVDLTKSPVKIDSNQTSDLDGSKKKIKSGKGRYKFAPVDNLTKKKPTPPIIKSISVSQLRKSSKSTTDHEIKINAANSNKISSVINNGARVESAPNKTSWKVLADKTVIAPSLDAHKAEKVYPEEEVIWKYTPIHSDKSETSNIQHDCSDIAQMTNDPSSTPLIPNRWKTVINLQSMHEDTEVQADNSMRNTYDTDQQEDIEKRLNNNIKDKEPSIDRITQNELPSSPNKMPNNIKYSNSTSPEQLSLDYSSDDLFETAEQNIHMKTIIELNPKISSVDVSDRNPTDNGDISNQSDEDDDNLLNELLSDDSEDNITNNKKVEMEVNVDSQSQSSDDSLYEFLEQTQILDSNKLPKNEGVKINKEPVTTIKEGIKDSIIPRKFWADWIFKRRNFVRLVILKINEVELERIGKQKILICQDMKEEQTTVIVRHPWVYLDFVVGDIVHIIEGKNSSNKRLLSDDIDPKTQLPNDNLLILNPDIILSATTVGNSIDCIRKAVIGEFFQDCREEPSLPMLVGSLVHELLQASFKKKIVDQKLDKQFVDEKLEELLESYSFSILLCGESKESVKNIIINEHYENILSFTDKYVSKSSYGCYVSISGTRRTEPISISDIIDIEEHIVSPMYGLKGFLDSTVEATVERNRYVVPLEIKTGKSRSISHEAQGMIYTLLLNDRYEIPVDFFLLYYTRDKSMSKFPRILSSLKHILMARNQLTTFMRHHLKEIYDTSTKDIQLPPIVRSSYCDNCYARDTCMTLNHLTEVENNELEYEKNVFLDNSPHTKNIERYRKFFKKYNDLINKEESSYKFISHQMFLMGSSEREEIYGTSLSNMVVTSIEDIKHPRFPCIFTFQRDKTSHSKPPLLLSQLTKNDYVLISDESGHFGLSQGQVVHISKDEIKISTDRKLLNNKINMNFSSSVMIKSTLHHETDYSALLATQNQVTYRIDRNDIQQGLSMARYNLLNLFMTPVLENTTVVDPRNSRERRVKYSEGGDIKTRKLLVDQEEPKFRSKDNPVIPYKLTNTENFNEDQLNAIDKVMRAEDYSLILGMPGTGKTTVIAEIIKILVKNNKSVLLTSYTHSAVDNILLKLENTGIDIFRLGSPSRIHDDIKKYIPDYTEVSSLNHYLDVIDKVPVVATTCLGIKDTLFSMKSKDFDYVIIDEASQVSLPVALGPIRFAERFVMVGDHFQLPPLVRSEAARLGGLEDSMFKILCEKHPKCVSELTYQYRMCEDIVKLSNKLIYNDKLKCGTINVANQQLKVSTDVDLTSYKVAGFSNNSYWLEKVINPENKVLFLDYDECSHIEEKSERDNITNTGEVELVRQCIEGMLQCGVSMKSIGVMTLYRAQLRLLKKTFEHEKYSSLEILTADQFQGRDKECIVISMVRSNPQMNGGSLLKELRRVNVAVTRAKSKLIIIGSRSTIGSVREIKSFIDLLESENWIYPLQGNCLDVYKFPLYEINKSKEYDSQNKKIGGAKPIKQDSKILKDMPIVRQALNE